MSLSGLQNERMPDRWDNIGGKISTETQNKTALTEGTSIKNDHTDGQNMWYDRTHHTPQLHTHTHKYKHTYIYSFIVMGGEVVRYGNREESQPRTVGLPYAVVDFGISSPLDAGFWIVFPHIYIRNGSHRAVLSTPSHMIECHPHQGSGMKTCTRNRPCGISDFSKNQLLNLRPDLAHTWPFPEDWCCQNWNLRTFFSGCRIII